MRSRVLFGLFMISLASLFGAGCVAGTSSGQAQSHQEEVFLGEANSARVEILMGAGRLEIAGGADSLLEGKFRYSHPSLAPDVRYRVSSSGVGTLDIEQEDSPKLQIDKNFLNDWDLTFNSQVPLELIVTLGAGESELDLGDLNLESLRMKMGAGETTLDLSDYAGQDLQIDLQGGVGELTLFLPSEARIEVKVRGGLGEINSVGLVRENGLYVNEYEGSGPTIEIRIEAGIGELNLIVK